MKYFIHCCKKDSKGVILSCMVSAGFLDAVKVPQEKTTIIKNIILFKSDYYTVLNGKEAAKVEQIDGKYIRTVGNTTLADNLDNLPNC